MTSYHCEVCKSSYIPDSLYRTYTAHKDKNNIDVEFVMEQVAQQQDNGRELKQSSV